MRVLFVTLAITAVALAGCTDDKYEGPIDAHKLRHFLIPAEVEVGQSFTFTLVIEPSPPGGDSFVDGAYYHGEIVRSEANYANRAGDCKQVEKRPDPGTYRITCTIDVPGTYSVFGHLQLDTKDFGKVNRHSLSGHGHLDDHFVTVVDPAAQDDGTA